MSGTLGVVWWLSAFPAVAYILVIIWNLPATLLPGNIGQVALVFGFMLPVAVIVWIATALLIWPFAGLVAATNKSVGFLLSSRTQVALLGGMTGFWMCSGFAHFIGAYMWPESAFLASLAAVMGHVGAIRAATNPKSWQSREVRPKQFAERPPQFQLQSIFMLTALIAVIVVCHRATEYQLIPAFVVYVVLQAAILIFDLMYRRFR